jgi:ubiquinone/menaquinone biosynthesis C-methylase UbiE
MDRSTFLSFDRLVDLYDETRRCDAGCFGAALDWIAERFPARPDGGILEPGIGTGRIALPLAERGYRVTGVDISTQMLDVLRGKARLPSAARRVEWAQADIARLPFADGAFELAVATHIFYFLSEWRRAAQEILRVVRRGRPVILMHTGTGMEIPFLNDRYKELCAALGRPIRLPGAEHTQDVTEYYRSLGCDVEWVRDRWRWTASIPLGRALAYIRRRAYSFTAEPPEEIHREAVRKLAEELRDRHPGLDGVIEVPNQVYLAVIRGPGSADGEERE